MTYRRVINQTTLSGKRSVVSQTLETQNTFIISAENSPNWVGYSTVADDGTPIVFKAHEHRTVAAQYNLNAIP